MLFDRFVKAVFGVAPYGVDFVDNDVATIKKTVKAAALFDVSSFSCPPVSVDLLDVVMPWPTIFVEYDSPFGRCGYLIHQVGEAQFSICGISPCSIDGEGGLVNLVVLYTLTPSGITPVRMFTLLDNRLVYPKQNTAEVQRALYDQELQRGAGGAMALIHTAISDSSNWIIEVRDEKAIARRAKAKKKSKVAGSHERPIYIVARHEELADKLHIPPHRCPARSFLGRRAHTRTYHHEKFYDEDEGAYFGEYRGRPHWLMADGQPRKQRIPHSYKKTNLPEENTVGHKRYRVCLECEAREPDESETGV